ncbi:hypothetical protein [Sandaracinus amylolyticus]|uniref:Lipoprotein n=1 Tax=Sandaracinus amylolyticus TaxID=927083 RepID=A0A0F6W7M5_9BACT|nr:hypothetical protein [Sandaracinus amylolyticus]AKF09346.1 hypothetical protein DB32_006495 [Sandaracinus amylolyticus]
MKKTTWFGTALAGLALLGCAGSGDVGRTGADLAYVDETTIEGRSDLFLDPSVSWRPQTLEQLGADESTVIPVDVEIYGGVAVAFRRYPGSLDAARTREDIVALFRVVERVEHITPTAGEVDETGEDGPVYVPGEPTTGLGTLDRNVIEQPRVDGFDFALVDWIDVSHLPTPDAYELWQELRENHPGC